MAAMAGTVVRLVGYRCGAPVATVATVATVSQAPQAPTGQPAGRRVVRARPEAMVVLAVQVVTAVG